MTSIDNIQRFGCVYLMASGEGLFMHSRLTMHAFLILPMQVNRGQTDGRKGLDINVEPVWLQGITGSGVVVSIMDNGGFVGI